MSRPAKSSELVDELLAGVQRELADGGTREQRIALAHALATARVADALESIDRNGLEIEVRNHVSVIAPDPISVIAD